MNPWPKGICIVSNSLVSISIVHAVEPLSVRIAKLEPMIGVHPPNIKSDKELDRIKKRYLQFKSELDSLLAKKPKDQELLYLRGHLQSMGHNFDYPGAWQGSTDDLKALLSENPGHIRGILELANLWVNSDPDLASNAESLYRGAQCYTGKKPLEEAQRGIFFALYFQGKFKEALRQSEYLKQTWPQEERYNKLNEITRTYMRSKGLDQEIGPATLKMSDCDQ